MRRGRRSSVTAEYSAPGLKRFAPRTTLRTVTTRRSRTSPVFEFSVSGYGNDRRRGSGARCPRPLGLVWSHWGPTRRGRAHCPDQSGYLVSSKAQALDALPSRGTAVATRDVPRLREFVVCTRGRPSPSGSGRAVVQGKEPHSVSAPRGFRPRRSRPCGGYGTGERHVSPRRVLGHSCRLRRHYAHGSCGCPFNRSPVNSSRRHRVNSERQPRSRPGA
jgi:hypothetical protein